MSTAIEYTTVKPEDLEMLREPRKSKISVRHKPTGTIAENPVVPGNLTEARFRRPTTLPKENRVKDMEGYIEGREDDGKLWVIIEGETPRNDYLTALAADPAALKASFEGTPAAASTPATPSGEDPAVVAATQPAAPAAPAAEAEVPTQAESDSDGDTGTESTAADEPEPSAVGDGDMEELDNLLAGLEG